jgi:transposase
MKPAYTEEDVQRALNYMGNGHSMRKAALEFGVPRSTLQDRTNGRISRQEAYIP